ncbi:RED-like protein N-terminal region-domain-containing protein [Trametes meyenii]|nr:RED-like protein N-terminal region-domain-containing protein [Trametes meyenii]
MDQESFRKLLEKPKGGTPSSTSSSAHVRGSLLAAATAGKSKGKDKDKKGGKPTIDASQPAFKPRQLKKGAKGDAYRDRATERRLGVGNDYAQVEALADEFERRHADEEDREAVEEKRKYLGGDSEHTVLVKGLDFALLEQTRARAAAEAAATDDVSLERAFLESRAAAQPGRRSRADILRELKSRRGGSGSVADATADEDEQGAQKAAGVGKDAALEAAKKAGKFKPIGFKPVGGGAQEREKAKRKKKVKAPGEPEENGERKKKRKVGPAAAATTAQDDATAAGPSNAAKLEQSEAGPSSAAPPNLPAPPAEPEPVDEDFDIFADAGEYTGVDLGDDSDENDWDRRGVSAGADELEREDGEVQGPRRKWLATSDDEREAARAISPAARATRSPSSSRRSPGVPEEGEMEEEGEEEEERPMRLQPLASSALPSIKDLLAMSDDVEKAEKRRARKEKKKAGGGGGGGGPPGEKETKAKVERDYQRLKAYTDKKAKS